MSQPNILIIHCDQLRFDCLGFNGNPDIQTPHLDCLAKDSVNYNNHYTVYPICTPSRYSFWSSLYVHRHGAWDNHATLPGGCPTFPKVLRENGYRTAAVGKMHMNPVYQDIGFSHMELAEQNGTGWFQDDYHRWLMERGKIDRFDLHHQSDLFREETTDHLYDMCQCAQSDLALENDSTEWITRRAKEQIERWEDGTPSMLMVGYINPHHPFDPPAPYSTMYDPDRLTLLPGYTQEPPAHDVKANGTAMKYELLTQRDIRLMTAAYYGMISEIDRGVGELLALLREKGLYENTMIVFTSDHGEYLGFHHMMLKCNYLYDPLAKIPLLIKYPACEHGGTVNSELTENIDVAPTVLKVCGCEVPDTMQGKDLAGAEKRAFVFSEGQYGTQTKPCIGYMLRTDKFKLLVKGSMECAMLFDLEKDPFELQNVVNVPEYQEVYRKMKEQLSDFVLFQSYGKVYSNQNEPQIRSQSELDAQAEQMKAFIQSVW